MKQSLKTYVYLVEVEQEADGRWSATIPELPGCGAWGQTRSEALQAINEAAYAYLLTLAEDGRLTVVHYHHGNDTLTRKTLRSFLQAVRWTEADCTRLGL